MPRLTGHRFLPSQQLFSDENRNFNSINKKLVTRNESHSIASTYLLTHSSKKSPRLLNIYTELSLFNIGLKLFQIQSFYILFSLFSIILFQFPSLPNICLYSHLPRLTTDGLIALKFNILFTTRMTFTSLY